jgi:hypothetical protein
MTPVTTTAAGIAFGAYDIVAGGVRAHGPPPDRRGHRPQPAHGRRARGVAPHIFESEEEATGAVHDTLPRQD